MEAHLGPFPATLPQQGVGFSNFRTPWGSLPWPPCHLSPPCPALFSTCPSDHNTQAALDCARCFWHVMWHLIGAHIPNSHPLPLGQLLIQSFFPWLLLWPDDLKRTTKQRQDSLWSWTLRGASVPFHNEIKRIYLFYLPCRAVVRMKVCLSLRFAVKPTAEVSGYYLFLYNLILMLHSIFNDSSNSLCCYLFYHLEAEKKKKA